MDGGREGRLETARRAQGHTWRGGQVSRWARFGSHPYWFVSPACANRIHRTRMVARSLRASPVQAETAGAQSLRRAARLVGWPTALKLRGGGGAPRADQRSPQHSPPPLHTLSALPAHLAVAACMRLRKHGKKPQRNLCALSWQFFLFCFFFCFFFFLSDFVSLHSLTRHNGQSACTKRGVRMACMRCAAWVSPPPPAHPAGTKGRAAAAIFAGATQLPWRWWATRAPLTAIDHITGWCEVMDGLCCAAANA